MLFAPLLVPQWCINFYSLLDIAIAAGGSVFTGYLVPLGNDSLNGHETTLPVDADNLVTFAFFSLATRGFLKVSGCQWFFNTSWFLRPFYQKKSSKKYMCAPQIIKQCSIFSTKNTRCKCHRDYKGLMCDHMDHRSIQQFFSENYDSLFGHAKVFICLYLFSSFFNTIKWTAEVTTP